MAAPAPVAARLAGRVGVAIRVEPAVRADTMREAFRARFAREPALWVRAPGRVDAMGTHTDYNEGCVLTLSIDRDTWVAAAPRDDGRIRAASLNLSGASEFDCGDVLGRRGAGWGVYVQAVAAVLAEAGCPLRGCDALVHGTLPIASGLSSSASLETAIGVLLAQLAGWAVEPLRLARLCQRAEVEIVGMSCGILDQYSALFGEAGSALLLDCRSLTHTRARIPDAVLPVICDTRAPRELTGSRYGERRASCEEGARRLASLLPGVRTLRDVDGEQLRRHAARLPPLVARRCRFVVEENARVSRMADAFERADRDAIGRLCRESFEGARDLFEVVVPAMQAMVDAAAEAPGLLGVRQAGAGFGGCLIAFVDAARAEAFARATEAAYRRATGVAPEVYPVHTAAGAGLLRDPSDSTARA